MSIRLNHSEMCTLRNPFDFSEEEDTRKSLERYLAYHEKKERGYNIFHYAKFRFSVMEMTERKDKGVVEREKDCRSMMDALFKLSRMLLQPDPKKRVSAMTILKVLEGVPTKPPKSPPYKMRIPDFSNEELEDDILSFVAYAGRVHCNNWIDSHRDISKMVPIVYYQTIFLWIRCIDIQDTCPNLIVSCYRLVLQYLNVDEDIRCSRVFGVSVKRLEKECTKIILHCRGVIYHKLDFKVHSTWNTDREQRFINRLLLLHSKEKSVRKRG